MTSIRDSYRLFLVDMDDTLFEERDFVRSGFKAVATHIARWGMEPDLAWDFLQARFSAFGRDKIFNHLLEKFEGKATPGRTAELVDVYREHQPQISLYPGVPDLLLALRSRGKVVVVTDGLTSVQEHKFAALGLDRLVDRVVFCDATGHPKPDPQSLAGLVEPGAQDAVLIGDRPDHDLALAERLHIDSIRVRTGRFRSVPNSPWVPVADVAEFAILLEPFSTGPSHGDPTEA